MPRVDLKVHFTEKDEVKRLGARWDAMLKTWYVPDGVDSRAFALWIPETGQSVEISADRFGIKTAHRECWKCHRLTQICGISIEKKKEFDEGYVEPVDLMMPFYINFIDESSLAVIQKEHPQYQLRFGKFIGAEYFMNLCQHCGVAQGDNFLFDEYDSGQLWIMAEEKVVNLPVTLSAGSVLGLNNL